MHHEVELLDGVETFLATLPAKMEAKAYWALNLLQRQGTALSEPYCKPVKGYKGLYELRVKFASDIIRLFYFRHCGTLFVVTSGYVKKTQKLNRQEVEKAQCLKDKYIKENPYDQIT